MATIQIVLDNELLQAADKAAKSEKTNRSALIREALQVHLKKLHIKELEERDRLGYERIPATAEELEDLEAASSWLD